MFDLEDSVQCDQNINIQQFKIPKRIKTRPDSINFRERIIIHLFSITEMRHVAGSLRIGMFVSEQAEQSEEQGIQDNQFAGDKICKIILSTIVILVFS